MSYAKAGEVLALAFDIASRHNGMHLAEIDQRWGDAASPTTARRRTQRILSALRTLFQGAYSEEIDEFGKVVRLQRNGLTKLSTLDARDIAALERSIDATRTYGDPNDAERLTNVLLAVRLLLPDKNRARTETDVEALLQSNQLAVRPGPRPLHDRNIIESLSDALLSVKQVSFDYHRDADVERHIVHPYGLITGHRAYLVARVAKTERGGPSVWRLDRIGNIKILMAPSHVPADFSLAEYAKRSFGVFQRDEEYGEVVWRFTPEAAKNASGFLFHPDQKMEGNTDGSLTVRFCAAGHLEMAWFLYQWGDKVEVLEPAILRELVSAYGRSDFLALP